MNRFENVSIFPTSEDIGRLEPPQTSSNKIDTNYFQLEHYLKTQFYLLREDVVGPLVKDVQQYMEDGIGIGTNIYPNLQFSKLRVTHHGLLMDMVFNHHFTAQFLLNSPQLMTNSLLVLSADNFKTMFFATVHKKTLDLLKENKVTIMVQSDFVEMFISLTSPQSIVAIESSVYFEAYRHSLDSLKDIRRERYIPFGKYLVHGRVQNVPSPTYLRSEVAPVQENLDESQFGALKAALNKEFVVIQGPPGTGKSFTGLRIVLELMARNSGTILIMAYKNDALDHFLESILASGCTSMIRFGHSNSEEVLPYMFQGSCQQPRASGKKVILQQILSIGNELMGIKAGTRFPGEGFYKNQSIFENQTDMLRWLGINANPLEHWERIKDGLENAQDHPNVPTLAEEERFELYGFLIEQYAATLEMVIEELTRGYRECEDDKVARNRSTYDIVRIIGMTITGATKYRDLIMRLFAPKIVVVEEASEVLEGHLVAAIPRSAQHLIMLGDHQQLQPIASNPKMRYKQMEVSMFERMIRKKLVYYQLTVQHRMRPCISRSMRDHFYDNLVDHESVKSYPNVPKMNGNNMFFFGHATLETKLDKSVINGHEAAFAIKLAQYLVTGDIKIDPARIAILAMYKKQVGEIERQIRANSKYSELFVATEDLPEKPTRNIVVQQAVTKPALTIVVTTVDSFQGQESDVVIVSFVRSNPDDILGFVGVSNRVCVALSRARHGLYCVGNFEMFARANKLWADIVQTLKKSNSIHGGKRLEIA